MQRLPAAARAAQIADPAGAHPIGDVLQAAVAPPWFFSGPAEGGQRWPQTPTIQLNGRSDWTLMTAVDVTTGRCPLAGTGGH